MTILRTISTYTIVAILVALFLQQTLWYIVYSTSTNPLDPRVGSITAKSNLPLILKSFYNTKRVLVVGGTRGIGRGVALNLARQGASVTVVGRSASSADQELLKKEKQMYSQHFEYMSADLSTSKGVLDLATRLHMEYGQFDEVVMTVSQWPNPENPSTSDGHDRTIGIGVLSRFLLIRRLIETRLLTHGARVLSVYASTKSDVPAPALDVVKGILKQEITFTGTLLSFVDILGTSSLVHDAMIQSTAKKYKGSVTMIGIHPGLVVTELLRSSIFPKWLIPLAKLAMVPVSRSEREIGWIVTQILASDNVGFLSEDANQARDVNSDLLFEHKAKDVHSFCYFNSLMEGRMADVRAYSETLQVWLEEEWFEPIYQRMKDGDGSTWD